MPSFVGIFGCVKVLVLFFFSFLFFFWWGGEGSIIDRYFLGYARTCRYFLGVKSGLDPSPYSMQKSEYPQPGA